MGPVDDEEGPPRPIAYVVVAAIAIAFLVIGYLSGWQ